jgi:hypothetical protein
MHHWQEPKGSRQVAKHPSFHYRMTVNYVGYVMG